MKDRANFFSIALIFLFLIFTLVTASAKEIVVDSNSNGDFRSIQAAINASYPGDKIIVKPNTYVEDIVIDKNLTIVSESGSFSDTIVKSAKGSDDVFSVWSNGVSIKGFSINGAKYAGIHLFGVTECNITNNNLSNNGCGIDLYMFSSGNTLDNNQISDSVTGISLGDSWFNSLKNNSISNCSGAISLFDSRDNTVQSNLISNNSEGISLIGESNGNTLTSNIVNSSTKTGLHLYGTSDNLIYNNYFNNTANVEFEESESVLGANIWNKDKTAGTNIVGDPYIGGNFWAKPDITGFSQISTDSDRDGIGDLLYNISENEFDYLPLVSLSTPEKPVYPVNNESGMNSSFDRIIVKGPSDPPVAEFNASPTTGNAPLLVHFTDLSQNTITGRNWNFGDGNISTETNPTHTYYEAGNYTVNLMVSNANGMNWTTQKITVNEAPIEEKILPAADFSAAPASGNAPLLVHFTDLSQNAIGRNWNFGDGNTSTEPNPGHTYTAAGNYNVTLTVYNANGTDSDFGTITVLDQSSAVLPAADFSSNVTSGSVPLSVQFTDLSKNAAGWNWDFRDGTTSTEQNPVHTYTAAGSYNVSLTVYNANGTNSYFGTITVLDQSSAVLPAADFSATPVSGNAPLSVQFTDLSKNAIGWNWNFDDGNISTAINPMHTYSKAGKFIVNLTVTNENGTGSKVLEIDVHEAPIKEKVLPVANFTAYPTSGNAPLNVQFTDSSRNAVGWNWAFGDGTTSTDKSPSHTYSAEGTYNVNLVVRNENGTGSKPGTITVSSSGGGSSSGGSSHSSGSSSGGGGGAGGSPEPQSNVESKELSQAFVTSGSSVRFDFPRNATSVLYITFNSKKTTGKTTTIVEMLKGKSTLVSQLPFGVVYKSLNIWVGNSGFATPSNIENSVVCFKVEKSWMRDKGVNQSSIILDRYSDNKWNALPTSLIGEDNNYFYFTAKTPGFSPFAITSNTAANTTSSNIQPAADTKIQPGANNGNLVQNGMASEIVPRSELTVEQKSAKGKNSSLTIFAMICMIALLLIAFLFKVDKKP